MGKRERAARDLATVLGAIVCPDCAGGGEVAYFAAGETGVKPLLLCPKCEGHGFLCRSGVRPLASSNRSLCVECGGDGASAPGAPSES